MVFLSSTEKKNPNDPITSKREGFFSFLLSMNSPIKRQIRQTTWKDAVLKIWQSRYRREMAYQSTRILQKQKQKEKLRWCNKDRSNICRTQSRVIKEGSCWLHQTAQNLSDKNHRMHSAWKTMPMPNLLHIITSVIYRFKCIIKSNITIVPIKSLFLVVGWVLFACGSDQPTIQKINTYDHNLTVV